MNVRAAIRYGWALTLGVAFVGFAPSATGISLKGLVVCEGQALPGVELHLRGDSVALTTVTDSKGAFQFQARPALYELEAALPGFQTIVLKEIDLAAPVAVGVLTVVLPRALEPPQPPLVQGPEIVPAPPLEVAFRLTSPKAGSERVTGVLTLVNRGSEPVPVPTRPWSFDESTRPVHLLMNIGVASPDFQVSYNAWTACRPPDGCPSLDPGRSVTFPIAFRDSSGGQDQPATFHGPGEFVFQAAVTLVPPGSPEKRTGTVQAEYVIGIPVNR